MSKRRLSELRNRLQALLAERRAGQVTSTPAIIADLRKRHAGLISGVSRQLEDMALTKLVSDVAHRRPRNVDGNQGNLFPGFPSLPQSIQIAPRSWRNLSDATIQQTKAWLSDRSVTNNSRRDRQPGVDKLIKKLESAGAKPNMTIREAWDRYMK